MGPKRPYPNAGASRRGALLAVALAALAGPACAETLADAVALAYQTNPQLQAQRAQLRALNETFVQARAGWGPRVSAEATLNYQDTRVAPQHVEGRSSSETLSLNQPIFTGGRTGAAVQAAEADVRAGRERLRQAEIDLLQRVVNAYVAVRRDQQVLQVARASVDVLRMQLEETNAKVEVRENTRTDLAQAQARLAAAQALAASFEAQLTQSRAQYYNAVGQNPGDLAPEPDLPGIPANIDEAFTAAEANNPTLLAAKHAEQGSRARVLQARTQNMPDVSLRVQAGRAPLNFTSSADIYANSFTAQTVFTQPLFTAGLNSSQIRRALELNNSDRLTIDSTRRNVVQGVSQQWSQLAAARAALTADQANVTASETAFFGMRQEERFGLRSTIELLNAQQELTSAQISLLRDRYTEYTSRVGVLNIMGVLSPELLSPGLKAYDPTSDFDRVKDKGFTPVEIVPHGLDAIVVPPRGPLRPARETTTPDRQMSLPPAPPEASAVPPMRSVIDLMSEEAREPQ